MRNATILVLTIRGLATEVIKNIVLAGIGKLIIADNEDVKEEDLGTGFFFRDEDVGRKVRLSTPSEFSLVAPPVPSDYQKAHVPPLESRCGQVEGAES
jgi:ubiquitin-like 1-activating enzyme E1 A